MSNYPDGLVSEQCGDVSSAFRSARKAVEYQLYDVEEILEHAGKALSAGDPREFVDLFDKSMRRDYPFHNSHGDAVREIDYLNDGLNDVDELLTRLESVKKKEVYLQFVKSLRGLQSEIGDYLNGLDDESFSMNWVMEGTDSARRVSCLYSQKRNEKSVGFETSHTREIDVYSRWGNKKRTVTAEDVILQAQFALRKMFEEQLPPVPDE